MLETTTVFEVGGKILVILVVLAFTFWYSHEKIDDTGTDTDDETDSGGHLE